LRKGSVAPESDNLGARRTPLSRNSFLPATTPVEVKQPMLHCVGAITPATPRAPRRMR
jgi:hypothetical protein